MSIRGFAWAQEVRVGDATLKVLLMTLGGYANTDNQTWHNQEKISFDTEIPVRTLRRKMQQLVEMGLILVEERRREDGTRTSSLITVLMPEANLAGGEHQRPNQGVTSGQNMGVPAANKVAGQGIEKNRKESKSKDDAYSEDFEMLWKQYPRTSGTPKKYAWDRYRMLNEENQAKVRIAVPQFAAAMRAEGRPEKMIPHMASWLSGRTFETLQAPSASIVGALAAPAKPFWERATRQEWISALLQWSTNWNWKKIWGPEPENPLRPNPAGAPKHHVPQDILDRFDLKYRGHLYSDEERAAIKVRVEAAEASKHAVDKQSAA